MPFTPPITSLHFYPKDTSPKTGLALSATQTAVGVLAYFAAAIGCLAAVISVWLKYRRRRHRRGDLYELEAMTSRYVPLSRQRKDSERCLIVNVSYSNHT
jgi:membrane associated rhomboid family serine protease